MHIDRCCGDLVTTLNGVVAHNWKAHLERRVSVTNDGSPLDGSTCGFYDTYTLDYKGGAKYPALERAKGEADLLSEILKPLAK